MSEIPVSTGAATTLARLQAAAKPAAGAGPETARRVAEEFEALFLSEMLAPVFESTETDGLFGGGEGEKIFRSMMVQERSEEHTSELQSLMRISYAVFCLKKKKKLKTMKSY